MSKSNTPVKSKFGTMYGDHISKGLVCHKEMDFYQVVTTDDGRVTGIEVSKDKKLKKHEIIQKGQSFINSTLNIIKNVQYGDNRVLPKTPGEYLRIKKNKEKLDTYQKELGKKALAKKVADKAAKKAADKDAENKKDGE